MIMGVHIGDNKLAITTEPKTFYVEDVEKHLKYEVEFFIKHNESLAEYSKKKILADYCSNISVKTIFMNTEKSKTNEPHKFVLDLRSSYICEAQKNILLFKTCQFITRGKI